MFMHMDVLTQFYLLQQMHNHIQNELQLKRLGSLQVICN